MDSGVDKASNTGKQFSCMFVFSHLIIHTIQHKIINVMISFLTNKSYSCQVNILFILKYDVEWIVFQTQSFLKG